MIKEFNRYGLSKYRPLVGYLELMGALGLLLGLKWKILLLMSSAGLSVLMLLGFLVRLKIKDKVTLLLPSFIYMLLSIYVFINVI